MIRSHSRLHKLIAATCGLAVWLTGMAARPAAGQQDVTSRQVRAEIRACMAAILQQQRADGTWKDWGHQGGVTALCTLALLNAGLEPGHPAVAKGIEAVRKVPDERTYVVSLKCQVLAAADPTGQKYRKELTEAVRYLVGLQNPNGMWSYGLRRGGRGVGDNSNTQFALLGLHEASKVGIDVPDAVWRRSTAHFAKSQGRRGGWGYRYQQGRARQKTYGSMTAAGVASLYICGQRVQQGGRKVFVDGRYPACGQYQQNIILAQGLGWMARNFTVTENPGGSNSWLHYYLYGMERVGMISGLRYFGEHDWYREGAAHLVSPAGQTNRLHDVSFKLLFLAKGNRPVLVQKLKWEGTREPSWNRNIHDLEHLTAWIGDRLGKRTTWQSVPLSVPLAELRQAPVLLITGHEFPKLDLAERTKLVAFVESGGTLLADACCGSDEFAEGFRAFVAQAFEPEGFTLRPLNLSHPVFHSHFDLDQTYGLEAIDVGCRTGVFFSPNALSCLWELRDVPESELAFKIGTNVAAFATGREQLADKLDVVELPEQVRSADRPAEIPRGAVRIARLFHNGDYNADPHCLPNLAALLRDKANVDVVSRERVLKVTDETLYEYPVVYMTGHYAFGFDDESLAALRRYLQRGGVLVADACCGRKEFDAAFRAMVKQLFPDKPLEMLPRTHPIISGRIGVRLGEVNYRKILADELNAPGTGHPPIEAVTVDGRTAILYSKYDWSCALEGDKPFSCRGYVDEDGKNLALNLLLYAISY